MGGLPQNLSHYYHLTSSIFPPEKVSLSVGGAKGSG